MKERPGGTFGEAWNEGDGTGGKERGDEEVRIRTFQTLVE